MIIGAKKGLGSSVVERVPESSGLLAVMPECKSGEIGETPRRGAIPLRHSTGRQVG